MLTNLFYQIRLWFIHHQIWVLRISRKVPFFGPLLIPGSLFSWVLWPVIPLLLLTEPEKSLPPLVFWLGIIWFGMVFLFMIWYLQWFLISIELLFGDEKTAELKSAKLQTKLRRKTS